MHSQDAPPAPPMPSEVVAVAPPVAETLGLPSRIDMRHYARSKVAER